MRGPRTKAMRRIDRALSITAAKRLNEALYRAYCEEYPLAENAERHRAVEKARSAYESISLMYFLGANVGSVHGRLKRRAKERKAAVRARVSTAGGEIRTQAEQYDAPVPVVAGATASPSSANPWKLGVHWGAA